MPSIAREAASDAHGWGSRVNTAGATAAPPVRDHRLDIDGLRSLAVLPVLLFHAHFSTFSGGFVGVDVFFVISGYLITSVILRDIERERFSIVTFYERRVRRILPALFLIIALCFVGSALVLLPPDFRDFSKSASGAVTSTSNIVFWSETARYFAMRES